MNLIVQDGSVEPGEVAAPADAASGLPWRWRARRALVRFGPRAVPALADALRTAADPAVRRFAAESLAWLGAGARIAVPALEEAARGDADPEVRAAAFAALGALAGTDA